MKGESNKSPLEEYKESLAKEIMRTEEIIITKTKKLEVIKKKNIRSPE